MPEKKFKILTISDHPLVSSGVGTQTRYILEGLLNTGKYQIRSLGGAIRHADYRPLKLSNYGDDWIIYPVNGYGDENIIREILDVEKPDALWFMTDPRFYVWLFNMSDEIRDRGIPMLYYHVWDNYPVPKFNKPFYDSCDFVGCISKLTHDILCQLGMSEKSQYIPHAVDATIFKPISEQLAMEQKVKLFGEKKKDAFVLFYNSRNARRKMTSDVVKVFKQFLDEVGEDKAVLLMHTDPHDQEGADLFAVCEMLGVKKENILFSNQRIPPEQMNIFYNMADATMNISNNEGFGLSCLESLTAGTLAIVNETGGLQDQIRDETGLEFGVSVKPATRSLTGSQQIPYIIDDRCADEDLVAALRKLYNMSRSDRKMLGLKARAWSRRAFRLEDMITNWDNAIMKYITEFKKNGYADRVRMKKV